MSKIEVLPLQFPSTFNVIIESCETTKFDHVEGFSEFFEQYIDDEPELLIYHNCFAAKFMEDPPEDLKEANPINNFQSLEDIFSELNNEHKSFSFFKMLYLRMAYHHLKSKDFFVLVETYHRTREPGQRRTLLKSYYYMMNYYDRILNLSKCLSKELVHLLIITRTYITSTVDDTYMKSIKSILLSNKVCICQLHALLRFIAEFGDMVIGSTTSSDSLIVFYLLRGIFYQMLGKHKKISRAFSWYYNPIKPKFYDNFRDFKLQLFEDYKTLYDVLVTNKFSSDFATSTFVHYNYILLRNLNNLSVNTKSSTIIPFCFEEARYNESYYIKTLLCFNTPLNFTFLGGNHVGSSEYYEPVFQEYLANCLESDIVYCNEFFLEIPCLSIILSLEVMFSLLNELLESFKKFASRPFSAQLKDDLASYVATLSKSMACSQVESQYQRSMAIYYNKHLRAIEGHILAVDPFHNIVEDASGKGNSMEIIIKCYHKYIFKNFFDILYIAIYRFGKMQYLYEIYDQNTRLFNSPQRHKLLTVHKEYIDQFVHKDYETFKLLFESISRGSYRNETTIEFSRLLKEISNEPKLDILKIMFSQLVNMKDVILSSGVRLSYRNDQKMYDSIELKALESD